MLLQGLINGISPCDYASFTDYYNVLSELGECAISHAFNYVPNGTGCIDGGLSCCDFSNCENSISVTNDRTQDNIMSGRDECGTTDTRENFSKEYLRGLERNLTNFRTKQKTRDASYTYNEHIALPVVFHDVIERVEMKMIIF